MRVFYALSPVQAYWLIAIQGLAVLTMFGGNILAIRQDNVKRLLAYSSVAHAGYLLVAVSAACGGNGTPQAQVIAQSAAFSALTFYLLAYSLMTMGAFGVLILLTRRGHDCQTMNDLKGLLRRDPQAAYIMLVFHAVAGRVSADDGFCGKTLYFQCRAACKSSVACDCAGAGKRNLHLLLSARSLDDVLSGTGQRRLDRSRPVSRPGHGDGLCQSDLLRCCLAWPRASRSR